MLDENLPAFFLKASSSGIKHQRDVFQSHWGSDPAPAYVLHSIDPSSSLQAHKNCYGAALFDSYSPEILYGEVIARPGWTQPTLSQEEMRRNNGIPPPPQPVLPNEFSIQLYNPEQQVRVEMKEGKWGASDSYEFSLPQSTFRTPSASNLDRGQSDPASLAYTPKIHFVWRRESKLSKDLTCFMTGRSTDTTLAGQKKRSARKDPDIAVALWRSMRELTVYEPNVQRLELEDPKGLEVVLILGAVGIKDLFFSGKEAMRDIFNISDVPGERKLSGGGRKLSNPQHTASIVGRPTSSSGYFTSPLTPNLPLRPPPSATNDAKRSSLPKLQTPSQRPVPPPADPRAQWQIDAETARLKAQAEAEAKEARRRRREREKADEAEAKRLQKIVEEEDRVRRKKQAEIDRETERLRRQYGVTEPIQPNQGRPNNRPYHQPSGSAMPMMSGANPAASSSLGLPMQRPAKKKSFFGLRSLSDETDGRRKLNTKQSAMW